MRDASIESENSRLKRARVLLPIAALELMVDCWIMLRRSNEYYIFAKPLRKLCYYNSTFSREMRLFSKRLYMWSIWWHITVCGLRIMTVRPHKKLFTVRKYWRRINKSCEVLRAGATVYRSRVGWISTPCTGRTGMLTRGYKKNKTKNDQWTYVPSYFTRTHIGKHHNPCSHKEMT